MSGLTRRSFLKGTAATAVVAGLAGCSQGSADPFAAPAADKYPIDPDGSNVAAKWSQEVIGEERRGEGWTRITNEGGATLGVMDTAKIIQVDGLAFKDLNGNGKLDLYEDWRQPAGARAADLASQLDADHMVPLMVVNGIVREDGGREESGGTFDEGSKAYLDEGHRELQGGNFKADTIQSVRWINAVQQYVESIDDFGIPVSLYADPFNDGSTSMGGAVWPSMMATAATFDPENARIAGQYISSCERCIGLCTELSPQCDVATEPTWDRLSTTVTEDPALARDMVRSYADGLQSTYDDDGNDLGWGMKSVNAMGKHWPGDGASQYGGNSHTLYGGYSVYPNGNFKTQLVPFVDGLMKLNGKTESCTALMPSYTINYSEDEEYGENVASAFSEYKLSLARAYGFDGFICTDWDVLSDAGTDYGRPMGGKPWGVEDLSVAERGSKAIQAGSDAFGGEGVYSHVVDSWEQLKKDMGEDKAVERIRESARRIVRNSFNVGIFENPYVSLEEAEATIGSKESIEAAEQVSLKSIVMLKNQGVIKKGLAADKPKVYVPLRYDCGKSYLFDSAATATTMFSEGVLEKYFDVVTDTLGEPTGAPMPMGDGSANLQYSDIVRATPEQLADCQFAIVPMCPPDNLWNVSGETAEGDFVPMSLQYEPFTADDASGVAKESIAQPHGKNLSPYGNTSVITNHTDLEMLQYVKQAMPEGAKTIVCMYPGTGMFNHRMVLCYGEVEPLADAILQSFGTTMDTFASILAGEVEPSGLLPVQEPKDMATVVAQATDTPRDMDPYVDADGNSYDFAFGLNWSGVIDDERVKTYKVAPLMEPESQPDESLIVK